MPQYLSPGVYVEEVPSGLQPIAGVGTSTAGFIGIAPDAIDVPGGIPISGEDIGVGSGSRKHFDLNEHPVLTDPDTLEIRVDGAPVAATLENQSGGARVNFKDAPPNNAPITADYITTAFKPAPVGEVKLCTNFSDFKKSFGDFSKDKHQNKLAQAVYGFFNNGGARCYVTRVTPSGNIEAALESFEAIDEIALVAAPGILDGAVQEAVIAHCEKTGDRFAILDGQPSPADIAPDAIRGETRSSDYAAMYFPWITVFDPASNDNKSVPPSGHIAGIYARVDTQRGVHKAPANEAVRSALSVAPRLSKAHQDGLNPDGINAIRILNNTPTVWGARTLGGDANGEWKYINTRRLFLFLRESIDQGTQWVVFEPNDPSLWAKITRNVTAFLTNVWRAGALFGATPQEAFYVKCDAETNPPEVRDLGQVVTEIGVATVKPAEFVIFRISQSAGASGS